MKQSTVGSSALTLTLAASLHCESSERFTTAGFSGDACVRGGAGHLLSLALIRQGRELILSLASSLAPRPQGTLPPIASAHLMRLKISLAVLVHLSVQDILS